MSVIPLGPIDLALAALLVLGAAALSWRMRLGVERQMAVAALRTTIQLLLVGLVLRALFAHVSLTWVTLIALIMLALAGREVWARQHRPFAGVWAWGLGTSSMFLSSFSVVVIALVVIVGPEPWYTPQYSIPLLGMLLGNTMTGIAIALDRLTQSAWEQRRVIEERLLLGADRFEAIHEVRRSCIRSGLIPIVNGMAAAGIVSLPGMMTGQILAGSSPIDAVRYQILIMFLIAGGTSFGTITAVAIGARRLFDDRHRLRLDRLAPERDAP